MEVPFALLYVQCLPLFWLCFGLHQQFFLLKTAATAGKEAHESGGGNTKVVELKNNSLKEAKIHHIAEGADNSLWVHRCT